jgi:hypothetical protein
MAEQIEVRNLSGETKTVGATVRPRQRDGRGRFKAREPRLVRPLSHPEGPGGYDAVVGIRPEGWIPGVRDNSQLHDLDRIRGHQNPQYVVRDWSGGYLPERRSNDHVRAMESDINHRSDCPFCTVAGC